MSSCFESLFEEFPKCRKCRDTIPEISPLPEDDFKFFWRPYLYGKPPIHFVFLGWEPSSAKPKPGEKFGTFSEPLHFAIRKFLLQNRANEGYLITNMAQCSMRTGELCDGTRDARFRECNEFLREQFSLLLFSGDQLRVISIGRKPRQFLERHRALCPGDIQPMDVHLVTHYSPKNNLLFDMFAGGCNGEFLEFCARYAAEYRDFLQTKEMMQKEFRDYFKRYGESQTMQRRDLSRLFKWQFEMRAILPLPR